MDNKKFVLISGILLAICAAASYLFLCHVLEGTGKDDPIL